MAKGQIDIHRYRTNNILVRLGFDVSLDTFASEIRKAEDPTSELLGAFTWTFATDGTDGDIILTMTSTVASAITLANGYMDVKRISGGEPYPCFSRPVEVAFIGAVTA